MYFSKKVSLYAEYNGVWGKGAGVFSRIFFSVKCNLALRKVTFNCKLQKKLGAGCITCSPIILFSCSPGSRAYVWVLFK